ncbi:MULTISPECIES: PilW family protein [Cellvibrio]|jgi:type IV pilus assembly protein PilW|uniref:Type IV pilus assembly protein PilW n=1 Tax=Cellvibrio fibrivorans TaxID=126350 RepID=A0ABU1V148_9GAMM|nr:PilW family protein [Cellvibrio fibrivorans]MDR7091135.1 type IV pilus assembly protein PilW [Cellvibrio fibrivorans]
MHLRQAGLSLVELMIAIALGLVLMTGVVQVFLSSKTVFSTQQAMSRIQETGRLAVDFLARDIRMAAYYGCYRPQAGVPSAALQNGAMVIEDLHGNFAEGVRGYTSVESLPGGVSDLGAGLKPLVGKTANVLVLRTANEVGLPVSNPNDSSGIYAYSPEPVNGQGCIAGMCLGSAVVVSDCFKARVFRLAEIPLAVGANVFHLRHNDNWGGGITPTQNFNTGEVSAMNSVVYFLAEGPTGTPSLWQKTNDDTALELLEGVEHMRITYATSANPEVYRLAEVLAAAEWALVTSIRVELVVRSIENNVVDATQPYTFAGAIVNPPNINGASDRYLRQVFSTTVGIRSRIQ